MTAAAAISRRFGDRGDFGHGCDVAAFRPRPNRGSENLHYAGEQAEVGLVVSHRANTTEQQRARMANADICAGSQSKRKAMVLLNVCFETCFTPVIVDRLQALDSYNPGFQAGRTTANAIYPVRTAALYCVQSNTELAALLDDLRWCFDTPANTAIE